MKKTIHLLTSMLIVFSLSAQQFFASDDNETLNESNNTPLKLNGYVRGSVFGNGIVHDFSYVFSEISLQNSLNYGKAHFKSDIRLRKGRFFDEEKLILQPKELFAGISSKKIDVLFGYQIVNWGRTDGFNPTNNISPIDYFFLSAEPDDQKESNLMLRLKYRFNLQTELELIGIPFYAASNYRFDLFDMEKNVQFTDTKLPERKLKNGTLAARMNFELPAAGWSLSFFDGFDPFHGYDLESVNWSNGQARLFNTPTPYRKTTLGAEAAVPTDNFIFRCEAAYNKTKNPENKMYIPETDLSLVVGVETQLEGTTVIGQYIGKIIPDFEAMSLPSFPNTPDPNAQMLYALQMMQYENRSMNRLIFQQQKKTNHAVSLSLIKSFGYDALEAELSAYYNFTSSDLMIRPKLVWKMGDDVSATFGGVYMNGKNKSLFTYTSDVLSGAFVQLKVSF
jgi:hypothetical protein